MPKFYTYDPDSLTEKDISAIWRRFLLNFALDKPKVRHISTSGLVDLLTDVESVLCTG